jgi:phosphoenolpyruvate synthase/pyruvate phosphate dikinase
VDKHIRRLEDVRAGDIGTAGGKATHLGEMAAHGFPVPPGFVVGAGACRALFEDMGLDASLSGLDGAAGSELAGRCAELRRRVVEAEMPATLAAAILAAHRRLVAGQGDLHCAVRSSATAEDQEGASFAGQHGTYYHVDATSLLGMIRHCWASLWSVEAVSYRASHRIRHADVFMAVVVQQMIRSEISGVAFTANPVSGDRGEVVIESSWGMGAAIVDGRVTPDRYLVSRKGGLSVREQRIAEKRFLVPARLQEDRAERMMPVPEAQRRRATLARDQVLEVARWSLRCEAHFGAPQDVEWAIADGRFHLLQSRPITTLGRDAEPRDPKGAYVLFKPLAENFTDPITPLTSDILLRVLPRTFRQIRGRVYLDLKYLRPLIPFALSDEDLANALYLSETKTVGWRLSLVKLPLAVATGLAAYLGTGVLLARSRGMPDDFMEGYRAVCRRVEADPRLGPLETFVRLWFLPGPFAPIGHLPGLVNGASLRFAPWMVALKKLLRRWVPELRDDAVALLCSGSPGVISAEMGRSLWDLATAAKRVPQVEELIARHPPEEALARLQEEPLARDFMASLEAFLAVHGHRSVKEFELMSARWRENPAPVIGMIRGYLSFEGQGGRPEEKAVHARAALEAEIERALSTRPFERPLRLRGRLIGLAARRARYYLKLRENSRSYHIMAMGSVRRKILDVEAALLRDGRLRCKDDVFFLRSDELSSLSAGRLSWMDVEDRIRERRLEHARLAKVAPRKTVGIWERRPEVGDPALGEGRVLLGQCASPGRYEGIARVILDPSVDEALRPGEVLVAPYTDPGWTPLFLTAGAAVVEVGSYLSHAGTVAREFGMPCLVDVADCTRRIQTGDRLEVDADGGRVRVLTGEGGA